jgi:signal transduction histidine kinase
LRRFLPTSLSGQIALVVAVALFVAQAINFGLLLNESRNARLGQVIFPAVTRIIDASERLNQPRDADDDNDRRGGRGGGRGPRVQVVEGNPIEARDERRPDIEHGVLRGLQDGGFPVRTVIATIRPIDPIQLERRGMDKVRADRLRRFGAEAWIAVERTDGKWLLVTTGWPRTEKVLIWQLIAQTLILYIVVLLPVLLAGRRIARPLRNLAEATRRFTPGDGASPVEERGPSDVRAVIAAYNSLSLRVNAMLDEKDRMLGAIGHDLRTPLAALRVRIESVEDDEDRNRMADTIDEMNRTLEDILSLARLGRPSEPPTDVDLAALIDAVVEDFRDLDMPVAFEEAPRLKMRMRPNLMRRAVRNLIENAVKYGHGAEVTLVPGEKYVSIEVGDRGPGIPEDKIASVFDPFTRLETSRNRETGGIGLGLALAQAIVRDAGGQIILANREGGGLCATIRLPRS